VEETKTCRNNTIFNLIGQTGVSTTNNILITGIEYGGIAGATMNTEISGNTIYSLRSQATGTASGGVNGISAGITQPKLIFNNKIYDLSNNLTVGVVNGIVTVFNVSNIYNNTIGDLKTPNLDALTHTNLSGIRCVNFTNANLFYNSIFLNATSLGTNFSSNAVLAETAGNLLMRNNILINNSVAKGTGLASAFTRADATLTTYNASSNNNLFVGSTIFSDGTTRDTTLAAFKTRMASRDQASVTEATTPFISTVGSSVDFLRLPTTPVSVANNAALPITSPAITTDYFGVTRSASTPDIGASEFNLFTQLQIDLNEVS
jgi:hypothetical protein